MKITNLLYASKITGHTLIGVIKNNFPVKHGNCFSVATEKGEFKIVNFKFENMEELNRRELKFPIKIMPLNKNIAIIHDERIQDDWYDDFWCETCCPNELLPIQQKLRHDRHEKQGVRIVYSGYITIDSSKKPTI